ncbi:hypothetical protein A9P79_19255 [Cupriavidus taiwanensis]|nr:hypothetical protein A9P79_19255 [Cupriavidus taiwanensis]
MVVVVTVETLLTLLTVVVLVVVSGFAWTPLALVFCEVLDPLCVTLEFGIVPAAAHMPTPLTVPYTCPFFAQLTNDGGSVGFVVVSIES